jgi:anaerobic selenocysteine-containing dehydrogenase
MSSVHLRTCHLCEAMCGIAIEHEGGKILAIQGDHQDPFSKGHVCPKALALKDLDEDPDRLRKPLRRTPSGGFEPIEWEDALELAATRLAAIRREHGKDAVGIYVGNPSVHNYATAVYLLPLLGALRTRNRYSATSVDQLPRMLSSFLLYGHQVLLPIPDIDRTDFFFVIGANPAVSNGSIMTAPGASRRIMAIKERGGHVVVVDPRRTETARIANEHHFIRPGTDALLLLAMLNVVFADGIQPGRLADFTDGFAEMRSLVARFTPDTVAPATGMAPEAIRSLAMRFKNARSAVCYGRVGVSIQEFGGLACWLCDVLNIVTGNLDRPGGALFTKPAADLVGLLSFMRQKGSFGRWKSRVRGLPEFGDELPMPAFAEEIETEGPGRMRGLITVCGNPVLSAPNGRRIEEALEKLDFMVSIDFYRNETSSHADLILPGTFALEQDQYELLLSTVSVRDTAKYSPPLRAKDPSARHDWEILHELTTRLLAKGPLLERIASPFVRLFLGKLGPTGFVDQLLKRGPYRLSVKKLADHPHGLDLGPLKPSLPERLGGARIKLAPEPFVKDVARLEKLLQRPIPALALIGRRQLKSNNSWMHNAPRLMKGKPRFSLLMHPSDAKERHLEDGQKARVSSRVGVVEVPVEVSDEMMQGVVSLPHGWGHGRPGVHLSVAAAQPGASMNDLTDESFYDELAGTAALSGIPVHVEALA